MRPPARDPRQYPPPAELKAVLRAICSLNSFTLDQVLAAPVASAPCSECCTVQELPTRPLRGPSRARWYFGSDRDGYIMVRARSASAARLWPTASTGEALPVRLHRWLANVGPYGETMHACDNPRCIRCSHVTEGTRAANVRDTWSRLRRVHAPSIPPRSTPRSEPPPPLPSHDPNIASREAIFVMTGFSSPTKLARALTRKKQGMTSPSSRGVLFSGLSSGVPCSHSNALVLWTAQ
jgi:hypothetical protein